MNDKLENKFSMYLSVEEVMADNEPRWAGVPKMVLTVNTFRGKIASIQSLREVQEEILKGITEDKDRRRKTMADLALKVGGAVIAYAADRDDNELKRSVSYSRSDLIYGRDTTAKSRCMKIYNKALGIASALVEWGISDADISTLLGAITAYGLVIEKPRTAKALSAAAGKEMTRVFKEVDGILKDKMDKLMLQYKDVSSPVAPAARAADVAPVAEVDFYTQYINAREIIDLGARHMKKGDAPPPPQE